MLIEYFSKAARHIETETIDADLIEYKITLDTLEEVANYIPEDFTENSYRTFFLYKEDSNIIDMLIDKVKGDRFVVGGIKDHEAILQQYIVKKGIEELLNMIHLNNYLY